MDYQLNNLWDELIKILKSEFDVNAYNTFFLPLVPKELNEDNLIVEAPTRFVKEVVSSDNFKKKIENVLVNNFGLNIEFIVNEKQKVEKIEENNLKANTVEIELEYQLNKDLLFDNFVVGPCNKECYEASLAVANVPGNLYNPLFIYGRAGIGKTHLLHAIGNYCLKNNKNKKVCYISANDFVDEFMKCSQNKSIETMKAKFRSIDILLLDDIQFLAGKDKTGEVFFHIFNSLFNEKKQIVLTSDRNPNELKGIETRLVSRFASGLTVGMNAPEYETAKAILKNKILNSTLNFNNVSDDVLDFIAENYSSDVRQLEGALTRLFFYVTTINKNNEITLEVAKEALKNLTPSKKKDKTYTASDIKRVICDYYNIPLEQLVGKSKVSSITTPRFIAIYLCRSLLNMTFEDIGLEFNRDHSSIVNACLKIENLINEDDIYKQVIHKITQMLTN